MTGAHSAENAPWTAEGQEKRNAVQSLFSQIAPKYDRLNSVMSLSLHHRWRAFAVSCLALRQGDKALDVCSGTGDFLKPLRTAVGTSGAVFGVDFCLPMLQVASMKQTEPLVEGDAMRLPVRSNLFDAVTVGWGIRNVPDIDRAHQEIARVLKPGGRFASLDMAKPHNSVMRWVSGTVFKTLVPLLGTLTGNRKAYTYLPKSTEKFWSREDLKSSMEKAGFEQVQFKDMFFGNICVHWGRKS